MTDVTAECQAAVTALTAGSSPGAPSLAGLLRPGAICLVWDRAGERLLWAAPGAQALARYLARDDGQVDPIGPWGLRLRELSRSHLPHDGVRLERVRLGSRLAPPTTFACRLIELSDGDAILTIVVGTVPTIRPVPRSLSPATTSDQPSDEPTEAVASQAPSPARLDPHSLRPRRFVWTSDAQGRFTTVSSPLAELAGDRHAAIIGRRWDELDGIAFDPSGAVAAGFGGRAAWRNAIALWRMADGRYRMPVAMAAAPLLDRDGTFQGFRGFGLCRPGEAAIDHTVPESASEPDGADTPDPVQDQATSVGSEESLASADATTGSPAEIADPLPASVEGRPAAEADEEADQPVPVALDATDRDCGQPVASSERAAEPAPTDLNAAAPPRAQLGARTEPGLHPVFQVLLDASLSGLSHLMASLPQPKPSPSGAAPDPDVSAPGLQQEFASTASGADTPSDAAHRIESVELAGPQPPTVDYGALTTRIGGQLGDVPKPPLLLAAPPAPSPAAPDVAETEDPEPDSALTEPHRPVLSFAERGAFHEIARALGARIQEPEAEDGESEPPRISAEIFQLPPPRVPHPDGVSVLDRLPVGVLVSRGETLLFANRTVLDLTGYPDLAAASALLLQGPIAAGGPASALLGTAPGGTIDVEIRAAAVEWGDSAAVLAVVAPQPDDDPARRIRALELDLAAGARHLAEAKAALDLAADGLITVDEGGRILSVNRAAERLFGYVEREVTGEAMSVLLAPESHRAALAALETARAAPQNVTEREMTGRRRDGSSVSLSLTVGNLGPLHAPVIGVIVRDNARLRRVEAALGHAKQASERADRQATDFLSRISHDVRTPLNAIIGFAEMMIEERFGPVGTERYKSYLADIRQSGMAVIKLVDDLLDLSRAMSGRAEIPAIGVDLNHLIAESVSTLQPLALRQRIVLRTSFAAGLPPLFVDARSLRQVVLNVLSNAIRFTDAGGQVIASTAITDQGETALRIRDTGIGMSPGEVEAALEPFRQVSATRSGEGRGLGLPLAKALVESNRGTFSIASAPERGTLVEVLFPGTAHPDAAGRREVVRLITQ